MLHLENCEEEQSGSGLAAETGFNRKPVAILGWSVGGVVDWG